jgi:hypothetical protein
MVGPTHRSNSNIQFSSDDRKKTCCGDAFILATKGSLDMTEIKACTEIRF